MPIAPDVLKLQSRAQNPRVKSTLPQLFHSGEYGHVSLVQKNFLHTIGNTAIRHTGIIVFVPEKHANTISVTGEVISPEHVDPDDFIDIGLDLLDPLVPRGNFDINIAELAQAYHSRNIAAIGALVSFEGVLNRRIGGMGLLVPSAVAEDPTFPYLDAVAQIPGASSTREELSSELTAGLVDTFIRSTTGKSA